MSKKSKNYTKSRAYSGSKTAFKISKIAFMIFGVLYLTWSLLVTVNIMNNVFRVNLNTDAAKKVESGVKVAEIEKDGSLTLEKGETVDGYKTVPKDAITNKYDTMYGTDIVFDTENGSLLKPLTTGDLVKWYVQLYVLSLGDIVVLEAYRVFIQRRKTKKAKVFFNILKAIMLVLGVAYSIWTLYVSWNMNVLIASKIEWLRWVSVIVCIIEVVGMLYTDDKVLELKSAETVTDEKGGNK